MNMEKTLQIVDRLSFLLEMKTREYNVLRDEYELLRNEYFKIAADKSVRDELNDKMDALKRKKEFDWEGELPF